MKSVALALITSLLGGSVLFAHSDSVESHGSADCDSSAAHIHAGACHFDADHCLACVASFQACNPEFHFASFQVEFKGGADRKELVSFRNEVFTSSRGPPSAE